MVLLWVLTNSSYPFLLALGPFLIAQDSVDDEASLWFIGH